MIGNKAQRLIGRAILTTALVGALVILVLIYVRSGGKGTGVAQTLALPASARGGGGGQQGGGSSSSGQSAGSGGPPLASRQSEPERGEGGGSEGQAPAGSAGPPAGGHSSRSAGATGTFTGPVIHTLYGPVQVAIAEESGRIGDVRALQLPTEHPQSLFISERVAPMLRTEVLQAQSAEINIVSGATFTSEGFAQSLQAALSHVRG